MTVKHVRMDNRLIHGQIAVAWGAALDTNRIIVTNDDVADDPLQVQLLKAVAPSGKKVSVLSVQDTVEYCQSPDGQEENIFIIAKFPQDGLALVEEGLEMNTLNLGNQAFVRGSEKLTNSIYLTEEGVRALQKLHDDLGVRITCRMMPDDPDRDCWPRIQKNFTEWLE